MLSKRSRSWLFQRWWRILIILVFAGPLVAIALVQYRWLEEVRSRSRMIESQRNRVTAQRAVALLQDHITGARLQTLPAVVHQDILDLNLDSLAEGFDEAHERFPYVDHFFVWASPATPEDTLFYFPEERRFRKVSEIIPRFPPEVWAINTDSRRWAEFSLTGSPPYQVVIHRVLKDDGSHQDGLVGFCVNLDTLARNYLPLFHAQRVVPLLREIRGSEEIAIKVVDESGKQVFGNQASLEGARADSSVELPLSFGVPSEGAESGIEAPVWRLSVSDDNDGIEEILKQGALGNLAIVGVGILVLGLGTVLIARTSAREAKLSDLKSRFISGISHELKTPLSMLRLYSEMLELGRVPDEMERKLFYRTLRQQAEAMGDMLEQILDFSRLESEQQPSRKEPCPPQEILEEAVQMLAASGTARQNVSLTTERNLPPLHCDRHSIARAVYNLLDNASKYSDPDQPIEVRAARRNGMLAVEVADRGIGISSEELPHIYERFYRGRASQEVKGTGLGLSIVDTVVKAHQGKIHVESEPAQGSRFTILLPLTEKSA
ncbi:MAG: HAMP domain-containing sensor histidine kinase [Vicinamibacteria bacterium]